MAGAGTSCRQPVGLMTCETVLNTGSPCSPIRRSEVASPRAFPSLPGKIGNTSFRAPCHFVTGAANASPTLNATRRTRHDANHRSICGGSGAGDIDSARHRGVRRRFPVLGVTLPPLFSSSLLKFHGADVSQRRMPSSRIVEAFDVVEHV